MTNAEFGVSSGPSASGAELYASASGVDEPSHGDRRAPHTRLEPRRAKGAGWSLDETAFVLNGPFEAYLQMNRLGDTPHDPHV